MFFQNSNNSVCGIFITFSGNCRKALTFYQTCFGGVLHFETFDRALHGYTEMPIVSGSLISDSIAIHGSDLVHNEGRQTGNYLSVFLQCKDIDTRKMLIEKLQSDKKSQSTINHEEQNLIEVIDDFDVRWVIAI